MKKKHALIITVASLLSLGALIGCNPGGNTSTGPDATSTSDTQPVEDYSFTASVRKNLNVGETAQINIEETNPGEAPRSFKYISKNPEIASVNETGLVTAVAKGQTTITINEETHKVSRTVSLNITQAVLANGGFNYASSSGDAAIATRTEILGKLEKYAMDQHLTGITLFENGGYVKYAERVQLPTTEYITGYGFGLLTEGTLKSDMPADKESNPDHRGYLHSATSSDPGTINARNDSGSQVSSLEGYITASYWGTKMNKTKNGYVWYPVLAQNTVKDKNGVSKDFDRPIPMYDKDNDGTFEEVKMGEDDPNPVGLYKRWRIYVKTGDIYFRYQGNPWEGHTFDRRPITIDDYEFAYRFILTGKHKQTRGKEMGGDWYDKNVVYPFGYGLSYTTFSQEITNKSALQAAALNGFETFDVEIKVTNTGTQHAGKQVVQLYAEAPYESGKIEKAYKVLAGFAKTSLLEPGKSETVKITVNPYDFASFDNHDLNGNGEKKFELNAGKYVFHAGTDAHNDFDTFEKTLAQTAIFKQGAETEVKPLFDEVTNWMGRGQNLSRKDFSQANPASFPQAPTEAELTLSAADIEKFDSFASTNDETYDKMPTTNAPLTVKLKELAGLDYGDELWDKFLDQLTADEMLTLFNEGCYKTEKIVRGGEVLVPSTTSADGPTGFVTFMGNPAVYGCCYYQSECLLAQTYNLELATEQAHAIGEESLVGNEADDGMPYPGWYAPAMNIHRSPFSGRNTEYYSEDPFISGKFAAQVVKGVQEKGVYANIKHFAVNDQETNRSSRGLATWLDEQAMREIYLRPFEIAVKEGKTHGLMTSFNRIGYEWAGGSYRLVTTILRKEWGFQGSVICDFKTDVYMDSKQMLYAGGDISLVGNKTIMLQTSGVYNTPYISFDNAKDVNLLRRSAHNNLYAIANSNMMRADIDHYEPAAWKVAIYVGDGVAGAGLAVWGFFAIFTSLRRKEELAAAVAE